MAGSMKTARFAPLLPVMLATVAGCASTTADYPSLATREAERIEGTALPADAESDAPPPAPLSPDIEARIARLVADARDAHRNFVARRPAAARTIANARGASRAGEAWISAQVALSGLDASRSGATVALADLDLLHAAEIEAQSDSQTPTAIALAAAREQVAGLVDQQNETIAQLSQQAGS